MIADLQQRLTGLGVPVLAPEDAELPNKGGRGGEKGGLALYLSAGHPGEGGYVQLNSPTGFISQRSGGLAVRRLHNVQIETCALTRERAEELAERVSTLLACTPARPTPYTEFIPWQSIPQAGCTRTVTTYQTTTFALATPGG